LSSTLYLGSLAVFWFSFHSELYSATRAFYFRRIQVYLARSASFDIFFISLYFWSVSLANSSTSHIKYYVEIIYNHNEYYTVLEHDLIFGSLLTLLFCNCKKTLNSTVHVYIQYFKFQMTFWLTHNVTCYVKPNQYLMHLQRNKKSTKTIMYFNLFKCFMIFQNNRIIVIFITLSHTMERMMEVNLHKCHRCDHIYARIVLKKNQCPRCDMDWPHYILF
jgi:hypothetical protein